MINNKAKQIVIQVGHSSYPNSNNQLRMCFSKAQAVRVLRMRGATRDQARKLVDATLKDGGAGLYSRNYAFQSVEIMDMAPSIRAGHYNVTKEMLDFWKSKPEA